MFITRRLVQRQVTRKPIVSGVPSLERGTQLLARDVNPVDHHISLWQIVVVSIIPARHVIFRVSLEPTCNIWEIDQHKGFREAERGEGGGLGLVGRRNSKEVWGYEDVRTGRQWMPNAQGVSSQLLFA